LRVLRNTNKYLHGNIKIQQKLFEFIINMLSLL
jgi:hypothetical protein